MRKQFQPSAALEVDPYDGQAYYSKALILSVQGFYTNDLGVLNTALQNLNKALQNLKGLLTQILAWGYEFTFPVRCFEPID